MANYKAYLILGSTVATDWASEAAVSAASIDGGHALTKSSGPNKYAADTAKNASITKTGNLYFVLVKADGSQFAVSGLYDESVYVYNHEATPPESSTATLSWTANSASFQNFQAAPEPTSGLLLLLGLAGLALKRKQA